MKRLTIFSSVLAVGIALMACNQSPTSLTLSGPAAIGEEGFAALTAQPVGGTGDVRWQIVSGGGKLLSDSGLSVTFEAPNLSANTKTRVRASLAANPDVFSDLDIDVHAPTAETKSDLGAAGGAITVGAVKVSFDPNALNANANVDLETLDVAVSPLPDGDTLSASSTRLEIPQSALGTPGDQGFKVELPAPTTTNQAVAEIRITRPDGSTFVTIQPYDESTHTYTFPNSVFNDLNTRPAALQSGGTTVRPQFIPFVVGVVITVIAVKNAVEGRPLTESPIDLDSPPKEIGRGLLQFESAFSASDLGSSDCKSDRQRLPSSRVRWAWTPDGMGVGTEGLRGKTPLVIVHGWQVTADIDGLKRRRAVVPGYCNWTDFLNQFYGSAGADLRSKYALFSFSYDSYQRVAGNGEQFAKALQATFGSTPVVVMAHSMGGLVTNRAMLTSPSSIARVITLGTPYQGSVALECASADTKACNEVKLNQGVANLLGNMGNAALAPIPIIGKLISVIPNGTTTNALLKTAARFDGTKDLAWEFSGSRNPFLTSTNAALTPAMLSKYTAFYGTATSAGDSFEKVSRIIAVTTGRLNDGIVPVGSACLSAVELDNTCAASKIPTVIQKPYDHSGLQDAPNFDGIKSVLLK